MNCKLFPYVIHPNKPTGEQDLDNENSGEKVGNLLHDGDEFVFKLTSFDKWVKVIINYSLKNHNHIKFTTKCEMRIVGYFPNSHFFNIIQKHVIDEWNRKIFEKRGVQDYYVLKEMSYINRKTIIERVDKKKDNDEVLLNYLRSPSNRLVEVSKDLSKERAKLKINKKNYVEKKIDESKRVGETFGHDG